MKKDKCNVKKQKQIPSGKPNNKDKAKCGFIPFYSLKVRWDEEGPSFLVRVRAQIFHPKTGVSL
jgi:hypothetical protein